MLTIPVLSALIKAADAEAGGNHFRAEKLVQDAMDEGFAKGTLSPSDFRPYVVARAALGDNYEAILSNPNMAEIKAAMDSSQFANILHKSLQKVAMDKYTHIGAELLELCTVSTADHVDYIEIPAMQDFEEMEERLPKQSFREVEFGADVVKCNLYDMGLILSIDFSVLYEDRKFQMIMDKAARLGESTATMIGKAVTQTIEFTETRSVFTKSEVTAASTKAFVLNGTAAESATFYAATHPSFDGQTNVNLDATGYGVDWDLFNQAYKLSAAITDKKGKPINVGMSQGLFPSIYKHDIDGILAAPNRFQIVTDAGTPGYHLHDTLPNTFQGSMKPYYTPFFAANTYAYMGDISSILKWFWVEEPNMLRQAGGHLELEQRIITRMRWACYFGLCFNDYRMIFKMAF